MGLFGKIFGNVPILGGLAKNIDNTLGRPGDIVNHPMNFLSNAAQGSLPFLTGPLAGALGTGVKMPGWASTLLGAAGGMGSMGSMGGGSSPWMNSAIGAAGLLGGPRYLDNGMGDKALGYADQLGLAGSSLLNKTMGEYADPVEARRRDPSSHLQDYISGYGKEYLRQGMMTPSLQDMGALRYLPSVMREQAQMAGVQNPFDPVDPGNANFTQSHNPYDLHPHEQEAYNQQANMVAQGRQAALGNLRTQLAARGIRDPRAIAAAEAQIHATHNRILTDTHANLQGQAYQNRQQTLGQFGQMLPAMYQMQNQRQNQYQDAGMNFLNFGNNLAQQGRDDQYRRLGISQSLMGAPLNAYEGAAQRAIGTNQYNQSQMGQNLGMLLSPWMNQNPYMNLFGGLFGGQSGQNSPNNPLWNGNLGGTPGQSGQYSGPDYETGDLRGY